METLSGIGFLALPVVLFVAGLVSLAVPLLIPALLAALPLLVSKGIQDYGNRRKDGLG